MVDACIEYIDYPAGPGRQNNNPVCEKDSFINGVRNEKNRKPEFSCNLQKEPLQLMGSPVIKGDALFPRIVEEETAE